MGFGMINRRHLLKGVLGTTVGLNILKPSMSLASSGPFGTMPILKASDITKAALIDTKEIKVSPGLEMPFSIDGVSIFYINLTRPDGTRLAASLYMPDDIPADAKIPAIFVLTPYQKDGRRLEHTAIESNYLVQHGYAVLTVDIRGTGSSSGIATQEYSKEETEDGVQLIDWLSKQPWSNGNIGMFGKSYAGFNTIQVAMQNPPALKAIIPAYATDDLYTDDVHYMGGVPQIMEDMYGISVNARNVLPPTPLYDINSPEALERFDQEPWIMAWRRNQTRNDFWKQGSLNVNYGAIKAATLCVSGFMDGYQNYALRAPANISAPWKTFIGPYIHQWPWDASVGPNLPLKYHLWIRWFDYWLKGIDNGVMDEPNTTIFTTKSHHQSFRYTGDMPGEWSHFNGIPESAMVASQRFYLHPDESRAVKQVEATHDQVGQGGGLSSQRPLTPSALKRRYLPAGGVHVKTFAPTSRDGVFGLDQSPSDRIGLMFDTNPLSKPQRLFGFAKARLFVAASAPVATWVVRLCDVAPDGTSHYISKGVLNGTHRHGHGNPEALTPGEIYQLDINLNATAYELKAGHRLRLVVVNGDWPHIWPSPFPMLTTLYTGGEKASYIELPMGHEAAVHAEEKLTYHPDPVTVIDPHAGVTYEEGDWPDVGYKHSVDLVKGENIINFNTDGRWITKMPHGISREFLDVMETRTSDADPAKTSMELNGERRIQTPAGQLNAIASGSVSSDANNFYITVETSLKHNGKVVREKTWRETIKRHLV